MRISEAYWVERYHRWQVNVQRDGKRKTFTSTLTGRKGKLEAERKADRWLEDPTSAETIQVGRLLDQYEEYLQGTKSAGHASQYCSFIRLYIRPVIGLIRINRLTRRFQPSRKCRRIRTNNCKKIKADTKTGISFFKWIIYQSKRKASSEAGSFTLTGGAGVRRRGSYLNLRQQ